MNEEKLRDQTVEAAVKAEANKPSNAEVARQGADMLNAALAGGYIVGAIPIADLPNVVLLQFARVEINPETGGSELVPRQLAVPNPAMKEEKVRSEIIMPGVGGVV